MRRAALVGFFMMACLPSAAAEKSLPWEDARRFAEALETIREQYAEPVDDSLLITEAIRGMAAGLDPYSVYLDPQEYEQARISATGRYEGIGVEVMREATGYVVVTPFDGGPAERAGLRPGDRLLKANGESLVALDLAQLNALLHGDSGSRVVLTVQRGDEDVFDVTLERELVTIPSVSAGMIGDDIVYLRIAMISEGSARDVARQLAREKVGGVVLDLRNNAGGVVDGAVDVADLFLDAGTIVSTHGRAEGQSHVYSATRGDIIPAVPIAVLINSGTASAAEIVAGALQDHGRALVIGSTSFGKGAVQSLLPLEGGGALRITTAFYRTPSGRMIEQAGIGPDIEADDAGGVLPESPAQDILVARAVDALTAMRRRGETGR